jgi:hypothetical protein
MIRREKPAIRRKKPATAGSFQNSSVWETKPDTNTRSSGPSPWTWYAMLRSPDRA